MDAMTTALLNFGGMGVVAAILLLLHRDAIKAFERQLSKERESNQVQWQSHLQLSIRQHEVTMQQLLAQDKMLDHLSQSQQRIHDRLNPPPSQ